MPQASQPIEKNAFMASLDMKLILIYIYIQIKVKNAESSPANNAKHKTSLFWNLKRKRIPQRYCEY